ncbi:hypothetical protein [Nocardia sp. alder85J]|uniref:hypothetical protein n=1 Tax=Nocardia sp. alder85J TaxID=2862949 RepID=UPI001CD7036A|nr:hypothetical protein [Nocardia sp. alder85J]MCX4098049.1 hypothetical protein [Nocardia sp. alder85J]
MTPVDWSNPDSYTRIAFADEAMPRVPLGDDQDAATALVNEALALKREFSSKLRVIANTHGDAAPTSAERTFELDEAIRQAAEKWFNRFLPEP